MIDIRLKNGTARSKSFESGVLYTDYFPQNRSFEDVCYSTMTTSRTANDVLKTCINIVG